MEMKPSRLTRSLTAIPTELSRNLYIYICTKLNLLNLRGASVSRIMEGRLIGKEILQSSFKPRQGKVY
jgi:hypothetical protein